MNLLEYIRKKLLSNKAKFFDQGSNGLKEFLATQAKPEAQVNQENAAQWECKKHDKLLLRAYSDHGSNSFVSRLNDSHSDTPVLPQLITESFAKSRIDQICIYFRDHHQQSGPSNTSK